MDGGNTKLADYGQNSDPSDFLNRGVQGANDPFNEFYTGTTIQDLSAVDKEQLDALGFHLVAANQPPVVTAADRSLARNVTVAASSLFSVTDADSDPIAAYQLWDSTADPTSGHWVVNGVAQGANVTIDVTAAQLSSTTFQSGSGSDDLWVRANDGFAWGGGRNFTLMRL